MSGRGASVRYSYALKQKVIKEIEQGKFTLARFGINAYN
jgi:hypothetical protein